VEIVVVANICQEYEEGNEDAAADVNMEKGEEMKEMIEQQQEGPKLDEDEEADETGTTKKQQKGSKGKGAAHNE